MDQERFCFIFGSYLSSKKIDKKSDIDLLCSKGITNNDVKKALLRRYPNLSLSTQLDINYVESVNGSIIHPICYWQDDKFEELFNDSATKIRAIRRYDIGAYLRDPNKSMFKQKLLSSNSIQFSNNNYSKVIDRHYGRDNFFDTIQSLQDDERKLYKKLYEKKWNLHKSCSNSFTIIRDKKRVILGDTEKTQHTFTQFIDKCLNHRSNGQKLLDE